MTLTQMLTRFRYFTDDDNGVRWPTAEATVYINSAYREYYNELVNRGYNGLLTTASMDFVAATETVALPTGFYKARRVERILTDRRIPMEYREPFEDAVDTTGTSGDFVPTYSMQGMFLKLNPIPASAVTGAMRIIYYPVMTELSGSASPVSGFSEQWHDMIPLKAALTASAGREEDDPSGLASLLLVMEKPYREALENMTEGRQYTEAFNTGDYSY